MSVNGASDEKYKSGRCVFDNVPTLVGENGQSCLGERTKLNVVKK